MADVATPLAGQELEHELERMLEIERFDPPDGVPEQALLSDPAVYERAGRDPEGWWAEQARALDWAQPWTQVLDWSNPPFAKWFVGGRLNASHNCLDRHVEAGPRRPRRLPLARRGGRAARRSPTPTSCATRKRLANALQGSRHQGRATSSASTCR